MPQTFRIGSEINPADPYWVQVREAAFEKAQELSVELIAVSMVEYPDVPATEAQNMAILEELLALELDALIVGALPRSLVYSIPQFGMPLVLLGETEIRHPLLISGQGYYAIAQTLGDHVAAQIDERGHVLIVGGMMPVGWQDDGVNRLAGAHAAFVQYPHITSMHIPSLWSYDYDLVFEHIRNALGQTDRPIDAIFGLSDGLALIARDAARQLGLASARTRVVGVGGTPLALAEVIHGRMTATMEIRTDELGKQAVELAYLAARRQNLPTHFTYRSRLVTSENVAEVAAGKLVAIASLPSRLVGARRRHQQERLTQLETSAEISRRIGRILDPRQLSLEIANLIRLSYGYDRVQIFHWSEEERLLTPESSDHESAPIAAIPLQEAGVLRMALERNEAIFIPDTRRSPRFPLDPTCPDTHTRVVLPIRLGDKTLGLLDLHSRYALLRTSHELIGLQSLADQLGIAIHNAELYSQALAARAVAEKADQLKTRLLANVSHELRTPLNVILRYIEMALAQPSSYANELPVDLVSDLRHVQRNAEHQLRLINDLLDLSRAEIEELELVPEFIELRPFLENVFNNFAETAESDIVWQLELPDRLPFIQADPTRFRQILLNLLSNALKFTDTGCIILGAEVSPPHVHVWVQDSGVGIPATQQERIFEPFVTVENRTRRSRGIGLGLSITRRLVALHHGVMTLDSEQGRGSTFHIYLPLPNLDAQSSAVAAQSPQPILLLISAHEDISAPIADFSRRLHLQIRQVHSGRDVGQLGEDIRPAAVAWDIGDAASEDWLLIQQLYRYPHICQAPFLLYKSDQDTSGNLAPGLTNLILKPVSGETLQEAIQGLLSPGAIDSILIVDDDPQTVQLYRDIVKQALPNRPVVTAANGLAALAEMSKATPSLVILDLVMPELDGYELLDHMRSAETTRRIPVLILSGQLLTLENVRRLEQHPHVTLQTKDLLTVDETIAAFQQAMFDDKPLSAPTAALVKRTLAFIHQNYDRPLSRAEIAESIGASQNYLSRVFREDMGLTPWQYLNRYRIKQARGLLRQNEDSITTIALEVGFEDPAYFSRIFSKEVGISPSAFRKSKA